MKILIVDDEQLARERLRDLILELDPDHEIREADNGKKTLQAITADPPDLVLLDIRMPVMDGLEAASHIAAMETGPAVVFTTAYQDHALAAFEANAVDYLLKPIRRERLQQAMNRAQVLTRGRIAGIMARDKGSRGRTCLSSTRSGKIELIPVAEIAYLKTEQKYVLAGWQGREVLIDEALKSLAQEFSDRFLRVHRNALVARDHIESLQKEADGHYSISLRGQAQRLTVSRRHLVNVRRAVKTLGTGNPA